MQSQPDAVEALGGFDAQMIPGNMHLDGVKPDHRTIDEKLSAVATLHHIVGDIELAAIHLHPRKPQADAEAGSRAAVAEYQQRAEPDLKPRICLSDPHHSATLKVMLPSSTPPGGSTAMPQSGSSMRLSPSFMLVTGSIAMMSRLGGQYTTRWRNTGSAVIVS